MPLFVILLLRLNRQYTLEAALLETDVPAAATAPILRRHVVLVFVDRLDMAAARAIQYARTLTPDELRAVHFVLDEPKAEELAEEWKRTGLAAGPPRARRHPRSAPQPRRGRVRRAGAVRRRDRGLGAAPRPQVPRDLAPRPPRQDGRLDPRGGLAPAARQRHHGAVPPRLARAEQVPLAAIVSGRRRRPARAAARALPSPAWATPASATLIPGGTPIIDATWRSARPGGGPGALGARRPAARCPHARADPDGRHRVDLRDLPRASRDRRASASAPGWRSRARSGSTRPGWPSSTRATSSSAEV